MFRLPTTYDKRTESHQSLPRFLTLLDLAVFRSFSRHGLVRLTFPTTRSTRFSVSLSSCFLLSVRSPFRPFRLCFIFFVFLFILLCIPDNRYQFYTHPKIKAQSSSAKVHSSSSSQLRRQRCTLVEMAVGCCWMEFQVDEVDENFWNVQTYKNSNRAFVPETFITGSTIDDESQVTHRWPAS